MTHQNQPIVIFALVAAALLWGFSFVATKIALETFDQFTLVFARFLAASVFFGIITLFRGRPKLPKSIHRRILLVALFQPVLYFLGETTGLDRTTATKTSLIIATIPGVVLLASRIGGRERVGATQVAGALVSIVGVSVLVLGEPEISLGGGGLVGDLAVIGAVIAAVFYIILTRSLAGSVGAFDITGMQFIYGALLFSPVYLLTAGRQDWSAVNTTSVLVLLYLIVGATIGGFLCYNFALTRIEASRASVYLNGIPIVATAAGWIILGERMTLLQGIGALIVLVGIFTVSRKRVSAAGSAGAD